MGDVYPTVSVLQTRARARYFISARTVSASTVEASLRHRQTLGSRTLTNTGVIDADR